ncbi:MAG TPA: hypothetical protein ENF52_05410 [Chloroflexi bacterium]|nr:hypothetical protein [Chloroflexota bacterium]
MKAIALLFEVEKDTKNTRRYQEKATDGPPVIGTLYVQQWALRKLGQGDLPDRLRVTISVPEPEDIAETKKVAQ